MVNLFFEDSLEAFKRALEQGKSLEILSDQRGWKEVSSAKVAAYDFLPRKNALDLQLALSFTKLLDRLESFPVRFGAAIEQPVNFLDNLSAGWAIISRLQTNHLNNSDPYFILLFKLLALSYRLEEENGGLVRAEAAPRQMGLLIYHAEKYKRINPLFWKKELTAFDQERLHECAPYPAFVDLVLQNTFLRSKLFDWLLRCGIKAQCFIEFPALADKLVQSNLADRIGRMGGNHLKVIKQQLQDGPQEKVAVLPFEGSYLSILDAKSIVTLREGYALSLQEIFDQFADKEANPGLVEYFAQGITNWSTHWLGPWNQAKQSISMININRVDWWLEMPIFEILTIKEARRRYGMFLDGKNWLAIAQACREYHTLDYEKSHAYLEVVIPIGNGCYSVYDFGKYPTRFSINLLRRLTSLAITQAATIAYADENVYKTFRQHLGYAFPLQPEEGETLMELIRQDIIAARSSNFTYQLAADNCGKWIQSRLEQSIGVDKIPNLFRVDLINVEPRGILKWIYRWVKKLPRMWHSKAISWILFPFGAWKGKWILDSQGNKKWVSMFKSKFWEEGIVYLPSYLHKQWESGNIEPQVIPERKHDADKGIYAHWDSETSNWIYH